MSVRAMTALVADHAFEVRMRSSPSFEIIIQPVSRTRFLRAYLHWNVGHDSVLPFTVLRVRPA